MHRARWVKDPGLLWRQSGLGALGLDRATFERERARDVEKRRARIGNRRERKLAVNGSHAGIIADPELRLRQACFAVERRAHSGAADEAEQIVRREALGDLLEAWRQIAGVAG